MAAALAEERRHATAGTGDDDGPGARQAAHLVELQDVDLAPVLLLTTPQAWIAGVAAAHVAMAVL